MSHIIISSGLPELRQGGGRSSLWRVSVALAAIPLLLFASRPPLHVRGVALARRGRGCVPYRCVAPTGPLLRALGAPACPGCCRRPPRPRPRAISLPSSGRRPWRVFAARGAFSLPALPATTGKIRATRVGGKSFLGHTESAGQRQLGRRLPPIARPLCASNGPARLCRRPAPFLTGVVAVRSGSRCAFSAPLGSWSAP